MPKAAGRRRTQPAYYLIRHSAYVAISAVLALSVFQIPLRVWQKAAPYLFLLGLGLLALVLVPAIGREVNGSRRWLSLYFVNLQPSELMKLFVVIYAADYTVRKAAYLNSVRRGFLPMLAVMLLTGMLLLKEPDFGAFAVIVVIAMGVLFLGGMNWRLFAGFDRDAGDRFCDADHDLALPVAAGDRVHRPSGSIPTAKAISSRTR